MPSGSEGLGKAEHMLIQGVNTCTKHCHRSVTEFTKQLFFYFSHSNLQYMYAVRTVCWDLWRGTRGVQPSWLIVKFALLSVSQRLSAWSGYTSRIHSSRRHFLCVEILPVCHFIRLLWNTTCSQMESKHAVLYCFKLPPKPSCLFLAELKYTPKYTEL